MRGIKKFIPAIIFALVTIIVLVGTVYAAVALGELPISLPFKSYASIDASIPESSVTIMDQWKDVKGYIPTEKFDTVDEIIEKVEVEVITGTELNSLFPLIEPKSLDEYIKNNPECLENGYEKLLIDEVDYMNKPTGIKTTKGDDVLAIDALDGILIIGRDIKSATGTSKVKIAVVNNKEQIDLSLVKDLNYWSVISDHAKASNAVLAVNASGYNWNDSGAYATLYGATKFHDTLFRKAVNPANLLCLGKDGTMTFASDINKAYNAVEVSPILIKDGKSVYTPTDKELRFAQSAIGQNADGTTFIVIASGGTYGSDLGVKASELSTVFNAYGVTNASILSGGSRAVMYWNGRVVNQTVDYSQDGVRLPNAIIVHHAAPGSIIPKANPAGDPAVKPEVAPVTGGATAVEGSTTPATTGAPTLKGEAPATPKAETPAKADTTVNQTTPTNGEVQSTEAKK